MTRDELAMEERVLRQSQEKRRISRSDAESELDRPGMPVVSTEPGTRRPKIVLA
jgi:hypothetical protein